MSSPEADTKKDHHIGDQPVVDDDGGLKKEGHHDVLHDEVLGDSDLMNEAFHGENTEHEQGAWESAKNHPMACIWAFIFCFTIVMESFDMFLNTNFVALTAFQKRYGVPNADGTGFTIPTKWQSALFQSGQCGAFLGVFMAGPITNRIGYRWTTILALILMNATIFISFFVSSFSLATDCASTKLTVPALFLLGRLPGRARRRTALRGYPLGSVHRQLACLRQ